MYKVFMVRNLESSTKMVLLSILHVSIIHNIVCWLMHAVCLCSIQDRSRCKKGFTVQIATCEDNVEDCRVLFMLLLTILANKNMRKRSNTSTECGKYTYTRVRNAESIPIVYYCKGRFVDRMHSYHR